MDDEKTPAQDWSFYRFGHGCPVYIEDSALA
jgi:hypothetical protein